MIIETVLLLLFAIMLALLINTAYSFLCLAPWVPTPLRELERIDRLAGLQKGGVFYEVGCGTAVVSSYIAKRNPEARVTGIELALPIYFFTRLLNLLRGHKNLKVEFGDALSKDYSDADVVYVYGFPKSVNGKLKEKLEKELKPGAKYISYAFAVKGWEGSGSFEDRPTPADVRMNVYTR